MAEKVKSGIQVRLEGDVEENSNGVVVHFAYKTKGGKWSKASNNFSKGLSDEEVMAQIRDFVEAGIALDSVQAPTLSEYQGQVIDLEDLPSRASLAAKETGD